MTEPAVDLTEAEGKTFACLEGCGYCCLCSPEVEGGALNVFMMDPALRTAIVPSGGTHRLMLQSESGACRFLKDRSCTIYEKRPRYCSSFPFHIHCGTRAQVNVDLSCRGLGTAAGPDAQGLDGILRAETRADAISYAREVVSRAPVEETVRRSRSAYRKFETKAREAGVWHGQEAIVGRLAPVVTSLTDRDFLGRAVGIFGGEAVQGPLEEAVSAAPPTELDTFLDETARSVFEAEDVGDLPVYIDSALSWHIFRIDGDEVVQNRLEESGVKEELSRRDAASIGLRLLEASAAKTLQDYLRLVSSRDIFTGLAYYAVADSGYEADADQTAFEELVTLATDLWWRASLIADLGGRSAVSVEDARDAIVFMDMDFLDSQTIGAVI